MLHRELALVFLSLTLFVGCNISTGKGPTEYVVEVVVGDRETYPDTFRDDIYPLDGDRTFVVEVSSPDSALVFHVSDIRIQIGTKSGKRDLFHIAFPDTLTLYSSHGRSARVVWTGVYGAGKALNSFRAEYVNVDKVFKPAGIWETR